MALSALLFCAGQRGFGGHQPPSRSFSFRQLDAVHELQPPTLNHDTPTNHTIDPAPLPQPDEREHQHAPGWEP